MLLRQFSVALMALTVSVLVTAGAWGAVLNEDVKLLASDGAAGDGLAGRPDGISVSGDTFVIGAQAHDDVGDADPHGAAYVYIRSGAGWIEQAKLVPDDVPTSPEPTQGSTFKVRNFGWSVSLDGDTAVIAAPRSDVSTFRTGAVYVFTRSGTTWTQQAKLTPSDPEPQHWFGYSVSVSGETIAVGAAFDDDAGTDSGAVYVFTRSGTTWTEQQKFTASDPVDGDRIGHSVSVDGDTIAVGTFRHTHLGVIQGGAWVFTRSGTTWTEQAELFASDPPGVLSGQVSLSGDTLLAAALNDAEDGVNAGAAYVFTRSGTAWTQQAKLTPSDGQAVNQLGDSISLDGDTAVIGGTTARTGFGPRTGKAYVFTRSGTTWNQDCATLLASDGEFNDQFGQVSLSGNTVAVGAPGDDDNGTDAGAAYVFGLSLTVCDSDFDDDGIPNDADNCPDDANSNQEDQDGDLLGDVCDPDIDGDGDLNDADNCPFDANADQLDTDGDGAGDVCDDDLDGDGVLDANDACVPSPVGDAVNTDGCAVGDLCPCAHPDGADRWKNHGAYVKCVAHATNDFVDAGLLTETEKDEIQSAAGASSCGDKN